MSERSLTVQELAAAVGTEVEVEECRSSALHGDGVGGGGSGLVEERPTRGANASNQSIRSHNMSLRSAFPQLGLPHLMSSDGDLLRVSGSALLRDGDCNGPPTDLPNDVTTADQVEALPNEFKSGDVKRPLKSTDDVTGDAHHYSLKPLTYSACFVLLLHLAQSFATYGIEGIITPLLVGSYDESWNANRTSVAATSYVSGVAAVSSAVPFVGGIVADGYLGDYWTLLTGTGLFYLPGLVLMGLTTIPGVLGPTFNDAALTAALLGLCPIGAGLVKTITSVYGAKQFHPVLQSSMIETYYIYYYQALNVGALSGGIVVPLLAQWNDAAAFLVPAALLAAGAMAFVAASRRYVTVAPRRDALSKTLQDINCCPCSYARKQEPSNRAARQLVRVVAVSSLKLPFDIAYSQMTTVFSIQALAMRPVGFIDAAMMLNANALASLLFGLVLSSWIYPALHQRGIVLGITHKFAIGTLLAAGAVLAAVLVDYAIHDAIAAGGKVSILWQTINYALIGIGELFIVPACLEAAFVIAPVDQKGLASAINLFMMSGPPNFLSIGLYNACSSWFPPGPPADTYGASHLYKYLWLLFGVTLAGTVLVLLPPVTRWVDSVYDEALKAGSSRVSGSLRQVETEIIVFTDDSSDSTSEGKGIPRGEGATTNNDHAAYLTSSDMRVYFVDLEMQDVLSLCDSDDHSYDPDSCRGSEVGDRVAALKKDHHHGFPPLASSAHEAASDLPSRLPTSPTLDEGVLGAKSIGASSSVTTHDETWHVIEC